MLLARCTTAHWALQLLAAGLLNLMLPLLLVLLLFVLLLLTPNSM